MRKSPSLIAAILSFGIVLHLGIALNQNSSYQQVKADEQTVQTYAYDQMVGLSASISGGDITHLNSDPNNLIDYGFRHGDVATGNVESFTNCATNRLGVEGSMGAAFLNWKMQTAKGDGAIIKFTANKKIFFDVSREKLGYDWKDTITLSIYKGSQLLQSKELADSTTTAEDFSFNCVLEAGETLYWQILSPATDAPRLIAMGAAGDYSTLPVFKVTEYVEYEQTSVTFPTLINKYIVGAQNYLKDTSNLFSYSFKSGSVETPSINSATFSTNTLNLGETRLTSSGIGTFAAYSNIILEIKAESRIKVVLSWNEDITNYVGIEVRYFLKSSKTKLAYQVDHIDEAKLANLSKNCILENDSTLLVQLLNTSNSVKTNIELLKSLNVEQNPSTSQTKSDYPIYNPTDYSNSTSITHKELAFETAKLNCSPITLKDGSISLTTGIVSEAEGELTKKFDTIKYDDGVYLYGQSVNPSMVLAGPNGTFNSDDQAVIEDYRLQTSISEGVVYKFVASTNTQLKVTHPAIDGGWVGAKIFIEALQYNQTTYKSLSKKYVENNPGEDSYKSQENEFAVTYNLKAGDTAYYVFGSEQALRRNLNIAPIFTTSSQDYSEAGREEIFGPTVVEAYLYQTVTDTINNNFEPVTYENTLTVGLYHGSVEEKLKFSKYAGLGNGSADDAIFTSTGVDSDAGFQRWQFHAGLSNDNAIVEFKAERDLKLVISHKTMGDLFYGPGASLRYYIADTDGFVEFKEERYLSKDTPDDFYGYQISLKEGQALIIEFTANDPEGYAVAAIEWVATANPKDYVANETNDFTDARDLQAFKDGLVSDLQQYVASLSEVDYTISNYALIEQYLADFIEDVKTLSDRDEIQSLYDETVTKIDAVLTILEEEEILNQARAEAIAEAEAYINARKSTYTSQEWANVLEEFESFKRAVNLETSPTNINLKLIEFKNTIDTMPATMSQVITTIIVCCSVAVVVLGAGALVAMLVIKRKKSK